MFYLLMYFFLPLDFIVASLSALSSLWNYLLGCSVPLPSAHLGIGSSTRPRPPYRLLCRVNCSSYSRLAACRILPTSPLLLLRDTMQQQQPSSLLLPMLAFGLPSLCYLQSPSEGSSPCRHQRYYSMRPRFLASIFSWSLFLLSTLLCVYSMEVEAVDVHGMAVVGVLF